ncbi:spore coat protein U [Pectobacterium actinidiae]|uniref:Spore coat U domain-containing protein n=1 Tax=Pectobacterium actinidiae TaxID=1507808 RepID=A0A1V2R6W3_9GAMM|nr:spore coat U domain-containing protein [Pectobacterium actinidiae]QDX96907.1 SCPU domain-containing protein [Pectobacterium carotovorum subsp. carotovorum]MDY4314242.1 spore coat U domain-containing protein [Pectobacterium actinidiae]ONK05842.1 spore coat protein U [Pectobacterium actinidiae]ONK08183.1 spore coat protein U [Pectobacterium actinidiae]GLW38400.1 spore coat U domain-containing protein [Pectobacterium carotovorum subsp. carotovorum]
MNSKRITLPILATLFTTFGFSHTASSVTINGQIPVSLTITAACTVNNGGGAGTTWGTIDFGSHSDLTAAIDSQVSSTGGNGITVNCSVGTPATLKIGAGANATASLRTLAPGTGTYNVPYRLYSDSTRSTEIPLSSTTGIAIVATGNPQLVPIYARIQPSDQTVLAPTAGSYTDTVTATIEW